MPQGLPPKLNLTKKKAKYLKKPLSFLAEQGRDEFLKRIPHSCLLLGEKLPVFPHCQILSQTLPFAKELKLIESPAYWLDEKNGSSLPGMSCFPYIEGSMPASLLILISYQGIINQDDTLSQTEIGTLDQLIIFQTQSSVSSPPRLMSSAAVLIFMYPPAHSIQWSDGHCCSQGHSQ